MRGIHSNGDFGNTGIDKYLMGADDLPAAAPAPAQPMVSKEIWYFLAAVAALLILKKVLKK